jgi:type IV pilus assembly protein PilB
MARKKIGEMLIEAGVLSETSLRTALAEQRRWGGTIGRTLVEMQLVREGDLLTVLSRQFGVPVVDLEKLSIPQQVLELVPGDLAQELSVVPFAQPMKFLDVAMADPTNVGVIDELRIRTQLNIRPHLAGPKTLERAIGKYYQRGFAQPHQYQSRAVIDLSTVDHIVPESEEATNIVLEAVRPYPRKTDAPAVERSPEIDALQTRVSRLEALVARDEEVLRKLLSLLVGKGVASREEILEAIR